MKKVITLLTVFVLASALAGFAQQDQSDQSGPSAQQPQSQSPDAGAQDPAASPAAQGSSFSGIIVTADNKCILNSNNTTYQLDDQQKAKQFVGQEVQVSGTLDSSTNMIHVSDINPAKQ